MARTSPAMTMKNRIGLPDLPPASAYPGAYRAKLARRGGILVSLAFLLFYVGTVVSRAHFTAPAPTPIVYDRHGVFLAQFGNDVAPADGRHLTEYGYWPIDPPPPRIVA